MGGGGSVVDEGLFAGGGSEGAGGSAGLGFWPGTGAVKGHLSGKMSHSASLSEFRGT